MIILEASVSYYVSFHRGKLTEHTVEINPSINNESVTERRGRVVGNPASYSCSNVGSQHLLWSSSVISEKLHDSTLN